MKFCDFLKLFDAYKICYTSRNISFQGKENSVTNMCTSSVSEYYYNIKHYSTYDGF